MKETKKNTQNNVHLYGYIDSVRMNELENGRVAVNLDVTTAESFKDREGNYQVRRSRHDATLFTGDADIIARFRKVAEVLEANAEGKGKEGFKPEVQTVSLDGMLVNRSNSFKGSEREYETLAVLVREDSVDLNVKPAEGERRNRVDINANIAAVNVYADKEFATIRAAHNYRPEGAKEAYTTWMDIRVNGRSPFSKAAYEAIVKGELKSGDFIQLGGQLRDNTFDVKLGDDIVKKYGNAIDLTSLKVLKRSEEEKVAETESVKAAAKASAKAKAEPKKATPKARKAAGRKI